MKKVCIIGSNGYVGKSMVELIKDKVNLSTKEIDDPYSVVDGVDVAIICVPTLMLEDGSCDTSIVEEVLKETNAKYYLIKSTIPPGTTRKLLHRYNKEIVFSPEYIGEGSYPIPFWHGIPHPTKAKWHAFMIFGGNRNTTNYMVDLFTPIMGPYCKFLQTDSVTAEMVKYMENSFLATKIVFCHEFSLIARNFGVDYRSSAIFNDKLGFDGKCLPKDINGIYHAAKEHGFDSSFLKQVIKTNEELRKRNG